MKSGVNTSAKSTEIEIRPAQRLCRITPAACPWLTDKNPASD
jgi:hypothetical protein